METIVIKNFEKDFFSTLKEIYDKERSIDSTYSPFFRGHGLSSWKLSPMLGRTEYLEKLKKSPGLENGLFRFFLTKGYMNLKGHSSWNVLFLMRHYGLPTRLLDWTSSVEVALFFAFRSAIEQKEVSENISICLLDVFKLNRKIPGMPLIFNPLDLKGESDDYGEFLLGKGNLKSKIFFLMPPVSNERMHAQRSYFTFHGDDEIKALEELYPEIVKKIEIDKSQMKLVELYLRSNDITIHSMFPDLDGLSRYLKDMFFNSEIRY